MAINFIPLGNAIDLVTSAVTDSITGSAITDALLTAVLKTEGGTTLATSSALTHTSGGVYKGTFDISAVSLTLNTHYYLAVAASNYAVQWKRLYRAEDRPLQGSGSVSIDTTPGTSGLLAVTGIPLGDGAGSYAAATPTQVTAAMGGGVIVYHKTGTLTAYVPTANTDAARGTALLAAAAASAQYDKLALSGGTFDVGANTVTVAANVTIQGCGWDQTIITGSKSGFPLILLVTGLQVCDVKVVITASDTNLRFPIGSLTSTSPASVQNVLIERVWIVGGSDGFYSIIGIGNDYDFTLRHCKIISNWDCVAIYDKDSTQPANSCTLTIDNCTLTTSGAYPTGQQNRAVVIEAIGSTTNIYSTQITAISSGGGVTVAYGILTTATINGVITVNVRGACRITASGGALESFDLNMGKALNVINVDPAVQLVEQTIGSTGTVNISGNTHPGSTSSTLEGRIWYDSSAHVLKYHNGSVVKTIATV